MEYDLHNNVNVVAVLAPVAIATNTTTNGVIIDTAEYGSLEYIVSAGVLTDGAYAFTIQESDDSGMSGATNVAADDLLGALASLAATDDGKIQRVGIIGKKRYQRIAVVSTGTTSGGLVGIVAVQGTPKRAPVADQ